MIKRSVVMVAFAAALLQGPSGAAGQAGVRTDSARTDSVRPDPVPSDSLAAAAAGKIAAKEVFTYGYFFYGFFTAPATVVSVSVLTTGEPKPKAAVSPMLFFLAITQSSRSNKLTPALRTQLQGNDSAYVRVFTKTYDTQLRKRRQSAFGLGALTGIVTSIGLLALAFRNYD